MSGPMTAADAQVSTNATLTNFRDVVSLFFSNGLCPLAAALFHYAAAVHSDPLDGWCISTFGVAAGASLTDASVNLEYDSVQRIFQHMPESTIGSARVVLDF